MCIVDRSSVQPLHDVFTHANDSRTLLRIQCRRHVWAEKLYPTVREKLYEVKRYTYLEEKCSCKSSSHKEKVRRVTHVARRVHVIRPQLEQRKGSFHTLVQ